MAVVGGEFLAFLVLSGLSVSFVACCSLLVGFALQEKENENEHQRNAQGGCANAELDLGFASGLGLGVPLNDVLDLDFLAPTFIERSLLV